MNAANRQHKAQLAIEHLIDQDVSDEAASQKM